MEPSNLFVALGDAQESLAASARSALGCDVEYAPPSVGAYAGDPPVLFGDAVSLYAAPEGTHAALHPFGVPLCALLIHQGISEALLSTLDALIWADDARLRAFMGVHPDVYLGGQEDAGGVCCLYVEGESGEAALNALPRFTSLPGALSLCRAKTGFSILYAAQGDAVSALMDAAQGMLTDAFTRAGFSGPYDRAVSALGCAEKARLAAQAADLGELRPFAQCRYDTLWRNAAQIVAQRGYYAEDFCHSAIAKIVACDAAEDGCSLESLRVYLQTGRNLRTAAQALCIHRNTMAYRIRRIGERFSLDLDDPNLCFELLFSCRAWQFLPKAPVKAEGAFSSCAIERGLWATIEGDAALEMGNALMRLLLIDIGDSDDGARAQLIEKVQSALNPCAIAFDDDCLYIALPEMSEEEIARADDALHDAGLRGALSQPLHAAQLNNQMRLMKRFTFYARDLCTQPGILSAQSLCSTLFFLFLQGHMNLTLFCCDEVVRVMDYDYERGSALSRSLYAYLAHFMDLKAAAAAMGMHRNTLDYQIKKVFPLIGGDTVDERLRFEMMCTYRILSTNGNAAYSL